ncbi:MAG: hypothetical protein EHM72_15725 [Calditrichaeota bacterium]|nr:MAG: hypothetical protein EHM72_15725 [Calditrichota bacterium]
MHSLIKNDRVSLLALAFLAFLTHWLANLYGVYGIFRDELYYLACADHLDWGYVDHPPLSIFILYCSRTVLGDSVTAVRLLPAVGSAILVYLTGIITKRCGGQRGAQALAALAVLSAPGYLGIHNIFSMNVFDHLFWAILLLLLLRLIEKNSAKDWIVFGIVAGLGLLNKLSVIFMLFSLALALLLTNQRRILFNRHLIIAALIALTLFAPHLIWQISHQWPTREFMHNAQQFKNVHMAAWPFLREQIINMNPFTVFLWFGGMWFVMLNKSMHRYRTFVFAYVILFILFIFQHGKPYYLYPYYPILFAFGALFLEKWRFKYAPILKTALVIGIINGALISLPLALPILQPAQFIRYADILGWRPTADENHQMGPLPQHFADMNGWEQMADKVAQVYHALPDSERNLTAVYFQNYGQAGAIDYYRDKYHLPPAICGHNNYFLWGARGCSGQILIIWGGKQQDHEQVYADVRAVGYFHHPYVMPYENDAVLYLCRHPKTSLDAVWPTVKNYN